MWSVRDLFVRWVVQVPSFKQIAHNRTGPDCSKHIIPKITIYIIIIQILKTSRFQRLCRTRTYTAVTSPYPTHRKPLLNHAKDLAPLHPAT